jgi:TRAP-type mannitol/chloroaromatic compound transport system permease small subunit
MLDALLWLVSQIGLGFYNFAYALSHPHEWLAWGDRTVLVKFIYYGASEEFFFVVFDSVLVILLIGLWKRQFLWGVVRGIEAFGNGVGRLAAWAGLIMVLQQIIVIFQQRIFLVSELSFGFGSAFTRDLGWYADELKLYNSMIVALCCAYTFIQGGHVRVDLFYAGARRRTKKIVDIAGPLFFMLPVMTLIWMYGWFFMWRHLVTPKISASDKLELLERKARLVKWNVETISFSPNGFDGYFLFKVLLVAFAGMMFAQGVAFFYRNLLELIEGPEADGKYHDADQLGDELAETVANIH